ncbi:MAG TPA: hypothetical protein VEF03_05770 [Candidatus Binataceae bacterium]|nr:hypothetical protein [Candidatus Binataceae bacterium]
MKIRFQIAALATAILTLAAAGRASAFGAPGAGIGAGPGASGGPGANFFAPTNITSPQRFRDMTLTVDGHLKSPGDASTDGRTMRLHVDNQDIQMVLAVDMRSAELAFGTNEDYARDLYHSLLTKRVEVIADDFTRDRIIKAADAGKPLEINGYVFDPTFPYLVVKSVREGNAH